MQVMYPYLETLCFECVHFDLKKCAVLVSDHFLPILICVNIMVAPDWYICHAPGRCSGALDSFCMCIRTREVRRNIFTPHIFTTSFCVLNFFIYDIVEKYT